MIKDFIEFSEDNGIATIRLCNERKRNALSAELINELNECVDYINNNNTIKVCIIRGSDEFFSAGVDIRELNDINEVDQEAMTLMNNWGHFSSVRCPTIACISGYAFGGGFELALMCDMIVAAENAVFGFPEVNIGLLPGNGGTQRLTSLIGVKRAFELISTGETIDAKTAHEYGIINKVVPVTTEYTESLALANKLLQKPTSALIAIKSALNFSQTGMNSRLEFERALFSHLLMSSEKKRLISAFLNRKK